MSYSDSTNLILIYFPYGADAREREQSSNIRRIEYFKSRLSTDIG